MAALLLASAVGAGLCFARVAVTGRATYLFLIKNLMLAWLPLLFALGASLWARRPGVIGLSGWTLCWLAFFPNAPYLVTDLAHLRPSGNVLLWYDVLLLPFFAWLGLLLGFASLILIEGVVKARLGRGAAWCTTALALGLGAFGIQMGRFGRLNSWDLLLRPQQVLVDVATTTLRELAFSAVLVVVLASLYLALVAFSRLAAPARVAS